MSKKASRSSARTLTQPTESTAMSFEIEEVMSPPEDDLELLQEFVTEATEHLEASDQHLLALEKDSDSEESLNAVFRAFHTIKGVAGFLDLLAINHLSHQAENLLDLARKGTLRLEGPRLELTFEAVDQLKGLIGLLRGHMEKDEKAAVPPSVLSLLQRLHAASSELENEGQKRTAESSALPSTPSNGSEASIEERADAAASANASRPASSTTKRGTGRELREPVKVAAERLDDLIDLIGELVIAESMVTQNSELRNGVSTQLTRQMAQLDKITRELQELGTSLRMVPVRGVFQKMLRLARDLSNRAGKSVEVVLEGVDTELDKTVVDKIGDPLVHMIRNAIDHGIEEDVESRRAVGKPEKGRVELRAFHKGGSIFIEIQDDGQGLDRKRIAAKAQERGLIETDEGMSDREVYALIFEPGFSTAQSVTDVSGRGVGMDVVRRNVESLRGQVEISSTLGLGTTFSIRLPLTLAIIDGMIVAVGAERYIVPTLSVVRSTRPMRDEIETIMEGGLLLNQQDQVIPVFSLGGLFKVPNSKRDLTHGILVVVEDDGQQVGILVDELLGQQQIVIKSLGRGTDRVEGVSGGAILSDGQVGLILDVTGLVRLARRAEDGRSMASLEKSVR